MSRGTDGRDEKAGKTSPESEGFFTKQDPLWIPYLMRDTRRQAEFQGLKFAWPRPDPVVVEIVDREDALRRFLDEAEPMLAGKPGQLVVEQDQQGLDIPNTATMTNGFYQLTIPASNQAAFYRLKSH